MSRRARQEEANRALEHIVTTNAPHEVTPAPLTKHENFADVKPPPVIPAQAETDIDPCVTRPFRHLRADSRSHPQFDTDPWVFLKLTANLIRNAWLSTSWLEPRAVRLKQG
jgi:hypothetical protein